MNVDNDLLGWVSSGVQKEIVIKMMTKPMIPSQIRKKASEYIARTHPLKGATRIEGISLNHVSNVLRKLAQKGVVRCVTEQRKVGRIYVLTPKGVEIQKILLQE